MKDDHRADVGQGTDFGRIQAGMWKDMRDRQIMSTGIPFCNRLRIDLDNYVHASKSKQELRFFNAMTRRIDQLEAVMAANGILELPSGVMEAFDQFWKRMIMRHGKGVQEWSGDAISQYRAHTSMTHGDTGTTNQVKPKLPVV